MRSPIGRNLGKGSVFLSALTDKGSYASHNSDIAIGTRVPAIVDGFEYWHIFVFYGILAAIDARSLGHFYINA